MKRIPGLLWLLATVTVVAGQTPLQVAFVDPALADGIPFPAALETANIEQERLRRARTCMTARF